MVGLVQVAQKVGQAVYSAGQDALFTASQMYKENNLKLPVEPQNTKDELMAAEHQEAMVAYAKAVKNNPLDPAISQDEQLKAGKAALEHAKSQGFAVVFNDNGFDLINSKQAEKAISKLAKNVSGKVFGDELEVAFAKLPAAKKVKALEDASMGLVSEDIQKAAYGMAQKEAEKSGAVMAHDLGANVKKGAAVVGEAGVFGGAAFMIASAVAAAPVAIAVAAVVGAVFMVKGGHLAKAMDETLKEERASLINNKAEEIVQVKLEKAMEVLGGLSKKMEGARDRFTDAGLKTEKDSLDAVMKTFYAKRSSVQTVNNQEQAADRSANNDNRSPDAPQEAVLAEAGTRTTLAPNAEGAVAVTTEERSEIQQLQESGKKVMPEEVKELIAKLRETDEGKVLLAIIAKDKGFTEVTGKPAKYSVIEEIDAEVRKELGRTTVPAESLAIAEEVYKTLHETTDANRKSAGIAIAESALRTATQEGLDKTLKALELQERGEKVPNFIMKDKEKVAGHVVETVAAAIENQYRGKVDLDEAREYARAYVKNRQTDIAKLEVQELQTATARGK